jgi:hypothetical protein
MNRRGAAYGGMRRGLRVGSGDGPTAFSVMRALYGSKLVLAFDSPLGIARSGDNAQLWTDQVSGAVVLSAAAASNEMGYTASNALARGVPTIDSYVTNSRCLRNGGVGFPEAAPAGSRPALVSCVLVRDSLAGTPNIVNASAAGGGAYQMQMYMYSGPGRHTANIRTTVTEYNAGVQAIDATKPRVIFNWLDASTGFHNQVDGTDSVSAAATAGINAGIGSFSIGGSVASTLTSNVSHIFHGLLSSAPTAGEIAATRAFFASYAGSAAP